MKSLNYCPPHTPVRSGCSSKQVFLKILQISHENFIQTLLKRDSNTGVSCEFWEIFKNTFLAEHLWTTASAFDKLLEMICRSYHLLSFQIAINICISIPGFISSSITLAILFVSLTRMFVDYRKFISLPHTKVLQNKIPIKLLQIRR